jgi:acyl-CoA synthetase (AMP-forming)/AMP-acid ligase II
MGEDRNLRWPAIQRWRTRHEVHYGDRLVRCYVERPRHVDAMFRDVVGRRAANEALVLDEHRITFAELDGIVERVAGNLAARGVASGDRVALLLGNRLEFVYLTLACARLGAIVVPMNVRQRRPEIAFVLNDCGAGTLVHEAELSDNLPPVEDAPALERRFSCGGPAPGAAPFAELLEEATAPSATIDEEDTACILYTSGTTGQPKGAMLTNLGLVHSVMHFEHCMGLDHRDRSILAVPASHVTGLVANILSLLSVGGCTIMMPAFKAADFIALAMRERLTQSVLVPAMYNLCLLEPDFDHHDLSSWRLGGYGGAPMPTATIAELARRLPGLELRNAFGATETTSPTTVMTPGDTADHIESVGRVVPCGEVRIMDDEGREVAPGEPGEIWIAGPMVVPGYWRNPDADAREFTGGYWRSGDIGCVDADGFVYIFDRKKDMINRAGYKVYSAEVENVLSHHPSVIECAIVARPDAVLGERVHAFIVCADQTADADALGAFCAERLSDYKVPEGYTFLDQPLPRNANGKILKNDLRATIPERSGNGDGEH